MASGGIKRFFKVLPASSNSTASTGSAACTTSDFKKTKEPPSKTSKLENSVEDQVNLECSPKENVHPATDTRLSPEQSQKMKDSQSRAKLIKLSRSLHGLVGPDIFGPSWYSALEDEFRKPYIQQLASFVAAERHKYTIYPPQRNVFSFTTACHINQVKVVIVGQDPYHGPNQAHGLSFSVCRGVTPPPSLQNMYKELISDIDGFRHPGHGDLTSWAKQGVLMLNAVLTVRAHQANSHKDQGWEKFTDSIIKYFNKQHNLVFILWGSYAQKKGAVLDRSRHCVLKGVHPSPLSAHRGFFGCKHFSQANEYLVSKAKQPINWSSLLT